MICLRYDGGRREIDSEFTQLNCPLIILPDASDFVRDVLKDGWCGL